MSLAVLAAALTMILDFYFYSSMFVIFNQGLQLLLRTRVYQVMVESRP